MRYDEAQQVRYQPWRCHVKAKLVGIKVQSNYNNVAANRLGVVPDTTDEAGCGPEPVSRDVGDADRKGFVVDGLPELSPTNWPT